MMAPPHRGPTVTPRTMAVTTTLVLCLVLVPAGPAGAQAPEPHSTLVDDNFDAAAPGAPAPGWTGASGKEGGARIVADPNGPGRAMLLWDHTDQRDGAGAVERSFDPQSERLTVSFRVYPRQLDTKERYSECFVQFHASDGSKVLDLYHRWRHYAVQAGGGKKALETARGVEGRWMPVRLDFDVRKRTFDVRIGDQAARNVPFDDKYAGKDIARVRLSIWDWAGRKGEVLFDDFRILGPPAQRQPLTEALALARAAAGRAKAGEAPGLYPKAAVDALAGAVRNAERLSQPADVRQSIVDTATAALRRAVAAFEAARCSADKAALAQRIAEAGPALAAAPAGTTPRQWPPAAKAALAGAIRAAEAVAADPFATQAKVDDAAEALARARNVFADAKAPDRAALAEQIAAAGKQLAAARPGRAPGQFPQDAIDAVAGRLAQARRTHDSTGASQRQIDAATAQLAAACRGFDEAMFADCGGLDRAIREAEAALASASPGTVPGKHPPSAVATVREALAAARAMRDRPPRPTQREVDAAAERLTDQTGILAGRRLTEAFRVRMVSAVDGAGEAVTHLDGVREVRVEVSVKATKALGREVCAIIGLYDEGGALRQFAGSARTIAPGEAATLAGVLRLPDGAKGWRVRAYVWDTIDTPADGGKLRISNEVSLPAGPAKTVWMMLIPAPPSISWRPESHHER